jgi:uncharacterized protein with ParB-like and HNH nuclease domain
MQYIIPIYQRTYSWTPSQCQQIWRDTLELAENKLVQSHFIGSIVYINIPTPIALPQQHVVIDGEQRLVTISLLLAALGKFIETTGVESDTSCKKIYNNYLLNSDEDGDRRYKLILTKNDKDTFVSVIESRELPCLPSNRINENYQFFENKIRNSGIDPNRIFDGIGKLLVVDVSLDPINDNPQLIFESLNSTGLDLSQADLIRNYILMGLEPKKQEELYNEHWLKIEDRFGHAENANQFDRFMRDYLTIQNSGNIPKIDEVYAKFKEYVQRSKDKDISDIIKIIKKYSEYFAKLALLEEEKEIKIKNVFEDIHTLKVDVSYPFLIEVYNDYAEKRLNLEDLLEILTLVESYVFRRAICGIPTNSLNKTFATLYRELDKEHYLESFKAVLMLKDSYRRFPGDDEFMQELLVKDLYHFRSRNYWITKLEMPRKHKEVNVEECTFEHIMPQNLSDVWKKELGKTGMGFITDILIPSATSL